jgi:hypothetical protein
MNERGGLSRRRVLEGAAALGLAAIGRNGRADQTTLDGPSDATSHVDTGSPRSFLPAGRSLVRVAIPEGVYATLGILGPRGALLGLDAPGPGLASLVRRRAPTEEDGLLPRFVGFAPRAAPSELELVVDVVDPVSVELACVPGQEEPAPTPKGLALGTETPRPLICFPLPTSDADGYALGVAARYAFLRVDVVRSLTRAFQKTKKKMGGDAIQISDASQWNGKRPKSDLDVIRHISHVGGCDVDLGLPANDTFPSSVRDHCRGVRLEPDRFGCSPGTAKGVDFERLAYLLGLLYEEGAIIKVYIDDAYRREVIRAARELSDKGVMKPAAFAGLGEDGVMVASAWHTDHVHVRFGGEKGTSPFVE